MTTAVVDNVTETLANSHIDLLHRLQAILESHPAGSAVRLLFIPEQLELEADEVLVQHVNPEQRTIELVPQKIDDLSPMDVILDTQVANPGDGAFNTYATSPQAASCLTRYNLKKQCVHIYD